MRWVVLDFETASSCNLKKSGAWRYAEDLDTEIICACFSVMGENPQNWVPSQHDTVLHGLALDPDVVFLAHNAQFEKAIWRKIMVPEFGFPLIPNGRWHDTMAVCAYKALPLKLEAVLHVLGIGEGKDMGGRKVALGLSKAGKTGNFDRSSELRARTLEYCAQDVREEVLLHQTLGWLPPTELTVWRINQRMNERGLRLDLDFITAAQKIVDDASAPLAAEFTTLTGLNLTQTVKFRSWLSDHECQVASTDKTTVAGLIGSDEDDDVVPREVPLRPEVARALRIRQLIGSSSVKKLKAMDLCVSFDGRARGTSQYHGTMPGRAAGRLLQPYNFPRGTIKIGEKMPAPDLIVDAIKTGDSGYVEKTIGPAVECVVSALRHAIVCDPGRRFISGDYAGIQARTVLAVAKQYDKCAIFSDDRLKRKGEDIYLSMASQIYERPCTVDDKLERQTGKNSVLGLGFQMAAKKFRAKYAKEHPLEFCEHIVQVYRKEWAPKVPYLWYGLQDAAIKCLRKKELVETEYGIAYGLEDKAMYARLPSGRKIWYQHPALVKETMPWLDEEGRPVHKVGITYCTNKNGVWKPVKAFGGLLTENAVMGIEVDIQRHAQQLLEKEGFPIVLEVYDEIMVEPKIADADEAAFKQIMLDVPTWVDALQIPIAVETWSGDRYRK